MIYDDLLDVRGSVGVLDDCRAVALPVLAGNDSDCDVGLTEDVDLEGTSGER